MQGSVSVLLAVLTTHTLAMTPAYISRRLLTEVLQPKTVDSGQLLLGFCTNIGDRAEQKVFVAFSVINTHFCFGSRLI